MSNSLNTRGEYKTPRLIHILWISLIIAVALSIYEQDWVTTMISLVVLSSTIYMITISKKMSFKIPSFFITTSIIFIYATLFLGEVANFYERFWWWDVVLHTGSAIGFGLIGIIILIVMLRRGKVDAHPGVVAFFGFSFAVAIGVVWEIFEFGMDQWFGMNMQKSGLVDTMGDLIVDCLGALFAALIGYLYLKDNKKAPLSGVIEEVAEE